jgi:hypothetical protein
VNKISKIDAVQMFATQKALFTEETPANFSFLSFNVD